MTDGFTRRKEQSKEEIRKAAWELFSQFGVEKVSIADIARRSGLAQATIYNNFGSKEALVREFVTQAVDHLVERVQVVLTLEKPYEEKIADFVRLISEMMAQGTVTDQDASAFHSRQDLHHDPDIQKIRDSAQAKVVELMVRFVQEGQAQRQVRADLSDDAFRLYFQAFMGIFIDPHFRQAYFRNPGVIQEVCALMIHGMSGGGDGN